MIDEQTFNLLFKIALACMFIPIGAWLAYKDYLKSKEKPKEANRTYDSTKNLK